MENVGNRSVVIYQAEIPDSWSLGLVPEIND